MSAEHLGSQSGKSVPGRQSADTDPAMPSSQIPLLACSTRFTQQRVQRTRPPAQGGGGAGRGEGGGGEGGGRIGGRRGEGGGEGGGNGGGGEGGLLPCRSRITSTATRSCLAPRSSLIQVWSLASVSQGVSWSSLQASMTASLVSASRYSIWWESISCVLRRRKRST